MMTWLIFMFHHHVGGVASGEKPVEQLMVNGVGKGARWFGIQIGETPK